MENRVEMFEIMEWLSDERNELMSNISKMEKRVRMVDEVLKFGAIIISMIEEDIEKKENH